MANRTSLETELQQALHRAGVRDVDTSARRRAEYSSDASLYRVPPTGVVFPRNRDDIAATLSVCRRLGLPLTARGSGTSIAGNAVGTGVVIDVGRHLDRIIAITPETSSAIVEPGVILDDLQRAAAPHGLRFGPDPSTHDRCTLGGMIGNNACGSRALGFGRTVDHVLGLEVLAGTGDLVDASRGHDQSRPSLARAANDVVVAHAAAIRAQLGTFNRQISGYGLHHLLPEHGSSLAKALVGSEGTCGVVSRATLSLVPIPATTLLIVLGYPDMPSAADAVPHLLPHTPTALEGLDARIVDVVRERRGPGATPVLPPGQGWLFVEMSGKSVAQLEAAAQSLITDAGALDHLVVSDVAEARALWRIREDGSGLVTRDGSTQFHAGWEDAAVPPSRLGAYLRDFETLLTHHGLSGVPYGHFGDGCVHVRIDFPLARPSGGEVFRLFLLDAARLVAAYGGSMSGEHGDGRARSELLPLMYSADVMDAFVAFKRVFDPEDLLNPGVIVRPRPIDADMRAGKKTASAVGLGFHYGSDAGDFHKAIHRCVGIGRCRTTGASREKVMCPSYVATGDEKDSTRGRARVLQEMITGEVIRDGWRSPEVHEALELCLACKGCASDCPTGVDMATYKAEVLYQTYRRRLRPAAHYSLGWLPRWARAASSAPRLVNRLLKTRSIARLVKRAGGIDARRPLPPFAEKTFRELFASRARRVDVAAPGSPVVLWVDTFTDHFAPEVGMAAVRVLDDAGFAVRLSPPGRCCGLTWISTGQLDTARRILRRTVDSLARDAAAGIPIVGLEPSCTAVLRSDAVELLGPDHSAARAVAVATRTLAELLMGKRPDWSPPRLAGRKVVAQPHCHHHAVLGWETDRALLRAAGAEVTAVGGCCGLAGNFGMERGHHNVSTAVAEWQLLPAVREAPMDAHILADGFSCRTQIDFLSDRRGLHLAQLLAGAPDTGSTSR